MTNHKKMIGKITQKTSQKIHIHPKMKKLLTAMFALLLLVMPSVMAYVDVRVDGMDDIYSRATLSVIPGETIPVEVYFDVANNASDVVVEVELSYGHGKKTEVSTDPIDAFVGTLYKEKVELKIRDDIETSPYGEIYTLSVTIKDGKGKILESTTVDLNLQRENDLLEIQKVMVPSFLEAGKPAIMTVVLKNIGSDEQEDVYVKVQSKELGLELEERAGDIASMDDDEDEDTATVDFPIRIPKDAYEGVYTFIIEAYNDNVEVSTTKTVSIEGIKKAEDTTEVVPMQKSLNIKQGSSGTYSISVLNLGDSAQTYSISLEGLDGWASYQTIPLGVKVGPEASQLIEVVLSVSDKALLGEHAFTVSIESNGEVVKELPLTANVEKSNKINAMLISVIVLAIVLVALVIILVKTRKSEDDAELEESYY